MNTTPDRTAGLRAARAKDSTDKRRRALAAIRTLETAGTPITAAAIARAAGVSTWLLYTDGIREHLDAARRRQASTTHPPRTGTPPAQAPPTPAGLRTDLALARAEIDPPAPTRTPRSPRPAPTPVPSPCPSSGSEVRPPDQKARSFRLKWRTDSGSKGAPVPR